jgi:hypothetical protein
LGYFKRVCDRNKDLEAHNEAMHLDAAKSERLKKEFEALLADAPFCARTILW